MNLVLDLGNTQLKVGIFDNNDMLLSQIVDYKNLQLLTEILKKYPIQKVGISNVRPVPADLKQIIENTRAVIYNWNDDLALPIEIIYKTPETLGRDRICNVLGAKSEYENKNVLVIDLGTCNKYDFLGADGKYYGGAISPGFKMRFESMHSFTDQLPLIETSIIDDFIGDSTVNSMRSGAYHGILGEINYFIRQYNSRFNDIVVVLTGGFASYFDKALKNYIFADPYLTLKGLNIILNFQVAR